MKGKVGSYATTSIDFNNWFKDEQKAITVKTKKQKNNKKIIYPIFLECAQITTDIFWEKKFNLWANGKLPKFFTVIDNCVHFNKGKISAKFEFTNDSVYNTKECVLFFKNNGGIFSTIDEKDGKEFDSYSLSSEEESIINWSTLTKKKQDFLLRSYVNDLSTLINLNDSEHNKLLQTISNTSIIFIVSYKR